MALSEINLNQLVENLTDSFISNSDFTVLRQSLTEPQPILWLSNEINSVLTKQCEADKKALGKRLTQNACEQQINDDLKEDKKDKKDTVSELRLKEEYLKQLCSLELDKGRCDIQLRTQQVIYEQEQYNLDQLNIRLDAIKRDIENSENQIRAITTQHTVHTHSSNNNVHVHQPHTLVYRFTSIEKLNLNSYLQNKDILIQQRNNIIWEISSKERAIENEKKNLKGFIDKKNQIEKQIFDIDYQLKNTLPFNEEQRELRKEERRKRELARCTEDPELEQLSISRKKSLKEEIAIESRKLDTQKQQMMQNALDLNYETYIKQLKNKLESGELLNCTYEEHSELSQIIPIMEEYLKKKEIVNTVNDSFHQEEITLDKLQKDLLNRQSEKQACIDSKNSLTKTNQDLLSKNESLAKERAAQNSSAKKALYVSLFGVGGTIASSAVVGAFVGTLATSSLFFLIPGGIGLVSVVSFVIAAGYFIKQASTGRKIEENSIKVKQNSEQISQNVEREAQIQSKNIPLINQQIVKTKNEISLKKEECARYQQELDFLLFSAKEVRTQYSGSNGFFNGSGGENYLYKPKVPKYEEIYPFNNLN